MSYKTSLELAYHIGYEDALARKMPDTNKVAVLNEDTCHADETDTVFCSYKGRGNRRNIVFGREFAIHVMECSECGRTYEHVNGTYEYCPHCGRRIVEVDA